MTEEVSRAARAVREVLDAMRLRASRWGAPRPRFWIDERTTKSCFECGVAFSLVTRKHHCRACGRVFCQKCSSHALPPRDDPGGPAERACDVCFASHAAAAEPPRASTSSAEKRVSARSPRVPDAALSRAASERLAGSNPTSAVSSRPASASASRRTGGRGDGTNGSESESESDEDESESDEDGDDLPAELPDADAERPESNFRDGARTDTATTNRGERRDARVCPSETRGYASEARPRADETATPTMEARREILKNKPPKRYRAGKPAYAAHAAHAAALADESLWAPPPPPRFEPGPRKESSSDQTTTTDRDDAPVNAALFRLAARFLRRAFFGTFGDVSEKYFSETETKTDASVRVWTRFVAALALECARAVEPSRFPEVPEYPERRTRFAVRYDADPLSYVSIQKVAAGTPAQSSVARDAWSLRRNVADRRMAKTKGVVHVTSAEALVSRWCLDDDGDGADARSSGVVEKCEKNVRVALLGGALEYQRATDKPRLASFSTLLDQEHEHLRAATARALVSKPDVALVERTVARFARDLFLERGVSLALGIGAEELRRLAFRLASSQSSLSSGDSDSSSRELPLGADGGSVRGVCAGWSVETLEETLTEVDDENEGTAKPSETFSSSPSRPPATTTTFMTFFGLTPGSGCVLTLRGAPPRALEAVASATRASVRAAYHLDRVAAFVAAAMASHAGAGASANAAAAFAKTLLRLCAETAFANATVPVVSRAFCPTRVHSHACDPPVGFRTNGNGSAGSGQTRVPAVAPYGPEDFPLGAALAQATAAERGVTECPNARCGEHPDAHVRVFYVRGGRVTMRARRNERASASARSYGAQSYGAQSRDADDDASVAWTYWSRCRRCAETFLSPGRADEASRPHPTPARASASPVAVPERALELSFARFLEMLGTDVPEVPEVPEETETETETRATETDEKGAAIFCRHASPRRRAHYFGSVLGTVCFVHDEMSPLALVVSPATDDDEGTRAASAYARPVSTLRAPRGDTIGTSHENHENHDNRHDARCATAAYALRSDAYAVAMGAFPEPSDPLAFVSRSANAASDAFDDHVALKEHGVTAYFAPQFRAARLAWWESRRERRSFASSEQTGSTFTVSRGAEKEKEKDVEAVFADALAECSPWDVGARGGKSRAFFARSRDGRFVVKQVSKVELECLLSGFAEAYFARLRANSLARVRANSRAHADASSEASTNSASSETDPARSREFAPPPTLLAATLGAFTVAPRRVSDRISKQRDQNDDQNESLDFVVLENAFYGAFTASEGNASWRAYDLKGSTRGRYAATTRDAETNAGDKDADASAADPPNVAETETVVLMDGNVAETCATDPIAIDSESFATLERAIRADVAFLESHNVMDYSLLVGIDESPNGRREVVVRVIDYLRQYTWDKQIESAVKSGVPSYEGAPTVLSPAKYARRFRRAARRYFLAVPEEDQKKPNERR